MRIWITRHGQTELNRQHLIQGHTDEPLNETGIKQAEAMRAQISRLPAYTVDNLPNEKAVPSNTNHVPANENAVWENTNCNPANDNAVPANDNPARGNIDRRQADAPHESVVTYSDAAYPDPSDSSRSRIAAVSGSNPDLGDGSDSSVTDYNSDPAAAIQRSGMHFDAVYSSPLQRAVKTASIIGDVTEDEIITDQRLIEACFGRYEGVKYWNMGIPMMLYWSFPEIFPAPRTVETIASLTGRSRDFLTELEQKPYNDVLIVCHGGIIRALCGYLADKRNGIIWRPRPQNCEIRIYESIKGKHRFISSIKPE